MGNFNEKYLSNFIILINQQVYFNLLNKKYQEFLFF
jgi:hypothetical protein